MNIESKNRLQGFPLVKYASEPASKADLFFVTSVLFRICMTQNAALMSVRLKLEKDLAKEIDEANEMLDQLYEMLQDDEDSDGDR